MERRLLLLWLLGSLPQFSNAQLPFYEEHFDQTSFPPGWTTDDHSANPADLHVLWEVCQDPSTCPPGTDDDLPAQFDPDYFNAPTYAGGYVFVDSDKANIPTGAADHISVLTSAAINCSAQSQVFARFYSVIGTYQSPAFEGAVLLVSSELDEIMALSDRIAVMYKGEIIDIVPRAEATREGLGLLMAGVHPRDAVAG